MQRLVSKNNQEPELENVNKTMTEVLLTPTQQRSVDSEESNLKASEEKLSPRCARLGMATSSFKFEFKKP